jgi:hypothetical protein
VSGAAPAATGFESESVGDGAQEVGEADGLADEVERLELAGVEFIEEEAAEGGLAKAWRSGDEEMEAACESVLGLEECRVEGVGAKERLRGAGGREWMALESEEGLEGDGVVGVHGGSV